jgi:hypothetical protein
LRKIRKDANLVWLMIPDSKAGSSATMNRRPPSSPRELGTLSTAAAPKGKFSAAQPSEIPRWVTKIRPAAERRNRGAGTLQTLPPRQPRIRRKLAVVSI